MPLAPGTRLGVYEIGASIGTGGMGQVFRATDTSLGRQVAIKILPDAFANDPDRLARFEREAKTLASLNHPHIAAIYAIEKSGPVRALVMELVEGEDLAQRIARGPLPLDEALPIARQIAEALEAAHERGVVHRDLKPANIKVRADGTVKVLDFGLAKAIDGAGEAGKAGRAGDVTNSPTITSPAMTAAGMILGTAAYMAPEQAKGRPVDKRADIWAFGCVLFEMLTGRRAFGGDSVTETLAAILKTDPDWSTLPDDVPSIVRSLLVGCLEKDPGRRASDIAVAKFLLDRSHVASAAPAAAANPPRRARWSWARVALVGLAGVAAGAGVASVVARRATTAAPTPPLARFGLTARPGTGMGRTGGDRDLAISAPGSHIAYVGTTGDLFLRAIDQLEPVALPGLRGSRGPFFSPDGQWLGFFDAGGWLKKVPVSGGAPIAICSINAGASRGATWLDDDTIVFATNESTGLWRVAAAGGTPAVLTTPDPATESDHLWPHAVPGRRALLFTSAPATGTQANARTMILDLESNTTSVLMEASADARYLSSGHLVYLVPSASLGPTLRVAAFDLERRTITGQSIAIGPVQAAATFGADFAVAANGTLVYAPATISSAARVLAWIDRNGREESINAPPRAYLYARISPDFSRVALDARDDESDIWIWEFARQTMTRLTTDPTPDRFPVWAPDGQTLFYTSEREGKPNVFRQRIDGATPPERITSGRNTQAPMSASPDGRFVIVRESSPTADLMLLPLAGDPTLRPLIKTTFTEQNGEVSPDGRWIAYESNESGQFEIYVRPFPDVNRGRWQISSDGGIYPLWSRDGRELFYMGMPSAGGPAAIKAVRVEPGSDWRNSPPATLSVNNQGRDNPIGGGARTYDVGPDGRFLVLRSTERGPGGGSSPGSGATMFNLVVVMNWQQELARLGPQQ